MVAGRKAGGRTKGTLNKATVEKLRVPMPMTRADFGKLIAEETEKWAKVGEVLRRQGNHESFSIAWSFPHFPSIKKEDQF
jgi:hypothetical protein